VKGPEEKRPTLTRDDIATITEINRQHVRLLERLKEAILDGDSLEEHAVARELVGLPKETAQ
jgi:hypothetical protein